jgi:hypothetical protein
VKRRTKRFVALLIKLLLVDPRDARTAAHESVSGCSAAMDTSDVLRVSLRQSGRTPRNGPLVDTAGDRTVCAAFPVALGQGTRDSEHRRLSWSSEFEAPRRELSARQPEALMAMDRTP